MTFAELTKIFVKDHRLNESEIAKGMHISQERYSSIVNTENGMNLFEFKCFCDVVNVSVDFALDYGINRKK